MHAIEKMCKEEGKLSEASNRDSVAHSTKILLLGLMVLKQTAVVLIARFARTRVPSHELYDSTHLILMTEATKLGLNTALEFWRGGGKNTFANITHEPTDTLKLAIPALLYFVQNYLTYVALENLAAPLFQVIYQGKLLFTAFLSIVVLKHHYTLQQWSCLVCLCVGIATIMLGQNSHKSIVKQNLPLGLSCTVLGGICSSFAGVHFEIIVKEDNSETKSVYMRNIQLAFFSVIIAAFSSNNDAGKAFFHGFSFWAWLLIILQATAGLMVAFILKYLDNVMKGLATGTSVVLSAIFSIVFFKTRFSIEFVSGSALILGGTLFFSNPLPLYGRSSTSILLIFTFLSIFVIIYLWYAQGAAIGLKSLDELSL